MRYSGNDNDSGSRIDPRPGIRRLYVADIEGGPGHLGLWLIPILFGSLLAALAPPILAQNDPVLVRDGFTETVLNEAGVVNVTVVDGQGFGPNDHGHRITDTFLANTGKAHLVQLYGEPVYRLGDQDIWGVNTAALMHHALNRIGGILWSATDDSPNYYYSGDSTAAWEPEWWDDEGDRPYLKEAIATAEWMTTQNILFISSLENTLIVSLEDPRAIYCDDYPHIYQSDYWLPHCGALDDYIAYSGVALDRTIFVGAIREGTTALAAVRAGGAFERNAIYVESPDASTSHATAVLAAYATNLAAANPAWGATRLKQELMALATDETLPYDFGPLDSLGSRVVKVIRPADAPTAIEGVADEIPDAFALAQNYPNPFNPETVIDYALPQTSHVRLAVYDMLGRTVTVLVDSVRPQGRHNVRFSAGSLPTGTYIYRLTANGETRVRKMMLLQ